jgi:hypothetical protein
VIAYYVHHHGSGHVHRATSIARHLDGDVIGLSSLDAPAGWPGRWTTLPDDAEGVDATHDDVSAGATLHWAPRHHAGLRERMALVSAALHSGSVHLLVADVSVEIALLARLHGVATATPQWHWHIAGPPASGKAPGPHPPNLHHHGWVDDPWPLLGEAGVVITHAGQNALAEVAAARRPAVIIPQPRPFDEQHATAEALVSADLGVVVPTWPEPHRWSAVLTSAQARGGDWSSWSRGDGAARAAAVLRDLAQHR